MPGGDRRYGRLLQLEGNERARDAHNRLTSMAKAIQHQMGLTWTESVRAADKYIYGDWRRPGDNGGPLLDD